MAIEKYELPLKEVIPITEGGTGATTPEQARQNLELGNMALKDNAIIDASISGKNITLKFADNSTKTLTTQDTSNIEYTTSKGFGYAKFSNGFILAWGYGSGAGVVTINKPIAFSTIKAVVTDYSPDEGASTESVVWYSNSGTDTYDKFGAQDGGGFTVLWIGKV